MRERPILFSGPMVRAILDGKKTQTRRVMKPQPEIRDGATFWRSPRYDNGDGVDYFHTRNTQGIMRAWVAACPYGATGDRLWLRETFNCCRHGEKHPACVQYRADGDDPELSWKPAIFMPRTLARITLAIESIRVERLQDITEEDARAEGVGVELPGALDDVPLSMPRDRFSVLWDQINSKRAPWSVNPWLWVITFRRVEP